MPPKTSAKLSQRKISPAVESAGSGSAPSAASAGSAAKKKISEAPGSERKEAVAQDFIAPPRPGNRPARKGRRQEWLRQFRSPASPLDCSSSRARRFHVRGDGLSWLPAALLLRGDARGADVRLALVQDAAARRFLLGKHFAARLLQRFVIGAEFFLHGRAARFRFLPRAFRALVALGQHALAWA